jgi:hypothetical protein
VVSRRAGAIRRDHTGTLREAIADWLRASAHPRVTLGVDSSLLSHRRLTWARKFGDNQGQMCGTSGLTLGKAQYWGGFPRALIPVYKRRPAPFFRQHTRGQADLR